MRRLRRRRGKRRWRRCRGGRAAHHRRQSCPSGGCGRWRHHRRGWHGACRCRHRCGGNTQRSAGLWRKLLQDGRGRRRWPKPGGTRAAHGRRRRGGGPRPEGWETHGRRRRVRDCGLEGGLRRRRQRTRGGAGRRCSCTRRGWAGGDGAPHGRRQPRGRRGRRQRGRGRGRCLRRCGGGGRKPLREGRGPREARGGGPRRRCRPCGGHPVRRRVALHAAVLRVRVLPSARGESWRRGVESRWRGRRGGHVWKQRRRGDGTLLHRRKAQEYLARPPCLCRRAARRRRRAGRCCRGWGRRPSHLGVEKAAAHGGRRPSDGEGGSRGWRCWAADARGTQEGRARGRRTREWRRRRSRRWKPARGRRCPRTGGLRALGQKGARGKGPGTTRGPRGCGRRRCGRTLCAGENALERRRLGRRCGRSWPLGGGGGAGKGEVPSWPWVAGGHVRSRRHRRGPGEAGRRRGRRGRRRGRGLELEAALRAGGGPPVQVQVTRKQRRWLHRRHALFLAHGTVP